jgi:hypothetical protein
MSELFPIITGHGDSDGFDLLWKNPNKSPTEFSATTISIDLSPYTFIAVAVIIDGSIEWKIFFKGEVYTQMLRNHVDRYGKYQDTKSDWYIRHKYMTVQVADSYIEFSALTKDYQEYWYDIDRHVSETKTENPTNFAIPLYIYGLR